MEKISKERAKNLKEVLAKQTEVSYLGLLLFLKM